MALLFALAPAAHPQSVDPCEGLTTQQHSDQAHDIIRATYSKQRWKHRHPLEDTARADLERHADCSDPHQVKADWEKRKQDFFLYRAYREITPYRCQSGPYGTWAIPCGIIECESHFAWSAHNPSGAAGPYQIMVGRIYPARSREDQLQNHRRAAEIWRDQGPGAWVCA